MFDFNTAYRVTVRDPLLQAKPYFLGIAVGVRPFSEEYPFPYELNGIGHGFEWIPNSPVWPVRRVFMDIVHGSVDRIEGKEKFAEFEGHDVVYIFEPLTVARLEEVKHDIQGYEKFVSDLVSDEDIQEFYVTSWLRPGWSPQRVVEAIQEAKAYPIGHISHRADGYDYQKQPNGEWVNIGPTFRVRHNFPVAADHEDDEVELDDDLLDDVPTGGPWKEHAEGLPGNTFRSFYEDDPELMHLPEEYRKRPTEERQRAIDRIMKTLHRKLFKGRSSVPADQAPTAVLTMGVPASGKSSAVKNVVSGSDLVHIDPDLIKEEIPEYQQAKNQRAKNAASIVHQESGWIAEQVRDEAVRQRMNLVFEGVGRDVEYYQDMIQWLRLNGYRIQLVLTHVEDADLAVARSNERGEKSGRWVPEERIREAIPLVPKNFLELTSEVDDFAVFDSSSFPLKLAWAREEGEEYVPDEALKDRMVQAGAVRDQSRRAVEAVALPPALPPMELANRFIRAWEVDHALFALRPKRFHRGQGIEMPGTDAPFRLRMPKA